ncbi:hypothetical protein SISNIDRAFT_530222 [Sistotremastrum niveocremeum HHB9708]|uniref:F-box domain-containing protein n=1 Tax=Sistotremastrum niveocremeum HHB9708 TaxID=1314777 RepID=A0A164Z0T1_9AGAM|nr:hypothetical protein SISNIDRAFT_530222 [Sistotremastrum niveocremeum HHB9708]
MPSRVSLPVELYRPIAENVDPVSPNALAQMDIEGNWSGARTLLNLSCVSKAWRPEAQRRLWSSIAISFITEDLKMDLALKIGLGERLSKRKKRFRGIIKKLEIMLSQGHTQHLRYLQLSLGDLQSRAAQSILPRDIIARISKIMEEAKDLQGLYVDCLRTPYQIEMVTKHTFPALEQLMIVIKRGTLDGPQPSQGHDIDFCSFLLRHPSVVELKIYDFVFDESRYEVSSSQPLLPVLRSFSGAVLTAKLLGQQQESLRTVTLRLKPFSSGSISAWAQSHIGGPFTGVHTLSFPDVSFPILDTSFLTWVGRSFPNIVKLEGLRLSLSMINALLSDPESMEKHLPTLKKLVVVTQKSLRQDNVSADDLKRAMRRLPCIFPSIEMCIQHSGCGEDACKMTMAYGEDGRVVDLKVESLYTPSLNLLNLMMM